MRVAIIGTAGRKRDLDLLSLSVFRRMFDAALAHTSPEDDFQSGGAAWADHIAVVAFLAERCRSLMLYLPAPFDLHRVQFGGPESYGDGSVANYYHRLFSRKVGHDTMAYIKLAIERGTQTVVLDGFKARNLLVGRCDKLIAETFGEGKVPRDGGTKHCWDHSTAATKIHIPIGTL